MYSGPVADGYGFHEHLIEGRSADGIDTIVTCDNGIAAGNEITMAKRTGHDGDSDRSS